MDQSIDLTSMNVVFCNGELEPRIVIKQEGGMVTMVKTTNSQDPENPVNHCSLGHMLPTHSPWNVDESGDMSPEGIVKAAAEGSRPGATLFKNGGSKAGNAVWMVSDEKLEILPRNQICRAAGELLEKRYFLKWNKPQIGNLHDGKRGAASSAFLRVYEHSMSTGRRVYMSEERSLRSGEPKSMFGPYDSEIAGEGTTRWKWMDPLTWNFRWQNGGLKLQLLVTRREFWQEETDLPGKRKESSTERTDGASTALAKPRWSTGATGRQRTFKSCTQEETWTGLWNRQGATHEQKKTPYSGCHDTAVHSRTRCFVCSRLHWCDQ
jgi:hypothetical protein